MRKVTQMVCSALESGLIIKVGNSRVDDNAMYLHGNKIAEFRDGVLWITNAGWRSQTTKERLNGLAGVSIQQKQGVWFLNGNEWDGGWTKV